MWGVVAAERCSNLAVPWELVAGEGSGARLGLCTSGRIVDGRASIPLVRVTFWDCAKAV